jgi:hypothetical protein
MTTACYTVIIIVYAVIALAIGRAAWKEWRGK